MAHVDDMIDNMPSIDSNPVIGTMVFTRGIKRDTENNNVVVTNIGFDRNLSYADYIGILELSCEAVDNGECDLMGKVNINGMPLLEVKKKKFKGELGSLTKDIVEENKDNMGIESKEQLREYFKTAINKAVNDKFDDIFAFCVASVLAVPKQEHTSVFEPEYYIRSIMRKSDVLDMICVGKRDKVEDGLGFMGKYNIPELKEAIEKYPVNYNKIIETLQEKQKDDNNIEKDI